jgi:hypothetical protein
MLRQTEDKTAPREFAAVGLLGRLLVIRFARHLRDSPTAFELLLPDGSGPRAHRNFLRRGSPVRLSARLAGSSPAFARSRPTAPVARI